MTEHQALPQDVLHTLLTTVRDTSWSWQEADIPQFAERMGWTDVVVTPGYGAEVDPGHGLDEDAFTIDVDGAPAEPGKSAVTRVAMHLTSTVPPGDKAGQLFLSDAFVAYLGVATSVLGEPTGRRSGSIPEARWRSAETTVILQQLANGVFLAWARNDFQDTWERSTDALSEED